MIVDIAKFKLQIYKGHELLGFEGLLELDELVKFGCKDSICPTDCDAMNAEYYSLDSWMNSWDEDEWQPFKTEIQISCLKGLLSHTIQSYITI